MFFIIKVYVTSVVRNDDEYEDTDTEEESEFDEQATLQKSTASKDCTVISDASKDTTVTSPKKDKKKKGNLSGFTTVRTSSRQKATK